MQFLHKPGRRRISSLAKTLAALATVGLVAAACGSSGGGTSNEPTGAGAGGSGSTAAAGENFGAGKTITIPDIGWAEDIALTNLWKQIWESQGFTVKTSSLGAGTIFTGLASGDLDVFFDTWLPVTHKDYWAKNKANLEDLGVWYDHASLHLTVPSYVKDVNSIADLKSHADEFDGTITGIEPSAGEMRVTKEDVIPQYGLTGVMDLQASSTSAMLAALDGAINDKDPIVVTLWRPHWAYAEYDLKDLKDPKGAMGQNEQIHIVAHKGFSEEFPKVAAQLKDFTANGGMDDATLGSLENVLRAADEGEKAEATQKWMDEHQDVVERLATVSSSS